MADILSIQSHVAYGYVGNRAAVFPLEVMGHEVSFINTVQFSNHTGYGEWTGEIFSAGHIRDVVKGLHNRDVIGNYAALLSGYLGSAALGAVVLETVQEIKAANHNAFYCCDPVMGDVGRGIFVQDDIPAFFRDHALKLADIITPNQFELGLLSGMDTGEQKDILAACAALHAKGPAYILVTSMESAQTPEDEIAMLLSVKGGAQWVVKTPKIAFETPPNGAGDMTAALFTGHIMNGELPETALEKTAASVYGIFQKTEALGRRELAIIQGQDDIKHPATTIKAQKL